jgi:hypothetical protein
MANHPSYFRRRIDNLSDAIYVFSSYCYGFFGRHYSSLTESSTCCCGDTFYLMTP